MLRTIALLSTALVSLAVLPQAAPADGLGAKEMTANYFNTTKLYAEWRAAINAVHQAGGDDDNLGDVTGMAMKLFPQDWRAESDDPRIEAQVDSEVRANTEALARARAEALAKAEADRPRLEAEARAKVEAEQAQIEAEAKAKVRAQIEADLRAKAVAEATAKAEADAKADIESAAKEKDKAEADAKAKADARMETEAVERQEDQVRKDKEAADAKAREEARMVAEAEARKQDAIRADTAAREARVRADKEKAQRKVEEEARIEEETRAAHDANIKKVHDDADAAALAKKARIAKFKTGAVRVDNTQLAYMCNDLARAQAFARANQNGGDADSAEPYQAACDVLAERGAPKEQKADGSWRYSQQP
jgi:hypothetical protein